MKKYMKYLLTRPLKIVWLSFVLLIVIGITTSLIVGWDDYISDNPIWICILIPVLLVAIFIVSMYQPYKEYKDGL